jgi:hypothetical protein
MLVGFSEVAHGRGLTSFIHGRQGTQNAGVVPVAVVFGEIAKPFVRVEEDVFVPTVGDPFDLDGAALKADRLVAVPRIFPACRGESAADLRLAA